MARQVKSDFERLEGRLTSLPAVHRIAFAAYCAERQYGTYVFASRCNRGLDPAMLRYAIGLCWAAAAGDAVSEIELLNVKEEIDDLIPDLREDSSEHASLVLDATAAVSYAIGACLSESVDNAIYASRSARDAVDEWIHAQMATTSEAQAGDVSSIAPEDVEHLQAAVDAHPLMKREMEMQHQVLEYLSAHSQIDQSDCSHIRGLVGDKSNIDLA